MNRLTLEEIVDIDAYERIRDDYRKRVIEHKQARRVSVGPRVSVVFEDRETLRYQIQEMTRIERTRDPAKLQVELDVYNELIPGLNELSATLFIEIPELDEIKPELLRMVGIDEHVSIALPGDEGGAASLIPARFDDRQMEADRISAVHYIRFTFTPEQTERFAAGASSLQITHPNYHHEVELRPEVRESLTNDLRGGCPTLLDSSKVAKTEVEVLLETDRLIARRVSPPGAPERIVVEAKTRTADPPTWSNADESLLLEVTRAARQLARDLAARAGGCRIRVDASADDPLHYELQALPRDGRRGRDGDAG